MSIATRKEREFKKRELLILKTAFDMLLKEGYIGFTIDKLAKEIEYAKGTVYKHFSCKEDIILRILIDAYSQRLKFIGRAKGLELTEREIMTTALVGAKLYNRLNPNLSRLILIARVGSIWNKVTDELKEEHSRLVSEGFTDVCELLKEAEKNGNIDLSLQDPNEIFYSILSLNIGYNALQDNNSPQKFMQSCMCGGVNMGDPNIALSRSLNVYMDGLNWKPLSSERNYIAFEKEIAEKVYPELVEMLRKGECFEYVSVDEK